MKPVTIVIPTFNTVALTRRCLESIIVQSHYPFSLAYHLIVVDNASTDGTREYLQGLQAPVDVIHNADNLGWVRAVNMGLERALDMDVDYTILANSDVVVPGDAWWLKRYVDLLQREDIGAVGPISNFAMWLQQDVEYRHLPAVHETRFLLGFFFATKAEVLRKVGLLDERFGSGGHDDFDLSIRIRKAGWKLLVNRKAFIFHYGSKTRGSIYGGSEGLMRENKRTREILAEKWGREVVNGLFTFPQGLEESPG